MIDPVLPPGSHAAAVEDARIRTQQQRVRERDRPPQSGDGDQPATSQQRGGDEAGTSTKQQQAGQPIFKDWASI